MAALAATAALAPARADFGVPVTLSAAGRDAFQPQVAVDRNGNAVVVWPRFDGANYRIQARARSAMGALGPIQNFSRPA